MNSCYRISYYLSQCDNLDLQFVLIRSSLFNSCGLWIRLRSFCAVCLHCWHYVRFSKKTNTKISFWGRDWLEIVTIQNSWRLQLDDILKVSGHEQSILCLRDLLSFLVSSSVSDWWLLFALWKIQFRVTLCKWLFQNIPDCRGKKMMCLNISLGAMLQTLLNYSVEIQAVLVDSKSETSYSKIVLSASYLGAAIQVSL